MGWGVGFYIIFAALFSVLIIDLFLRKKCKSIKGKHVVITGGSSGIGLHAAIDCARRGAHVTIIARRLPLLENALESLEDNRQDTTQKFNYRSADVSRSYNEAAMALQEIEEFIGPIYMLVNCAGMAICGVFEEVSIDDAKRLMDLNYFGTYYCTRFLLPKLKAAGDGIIVITASQAALLGIYGYSAYAATKFALRGLAESVAMECKHKGVTITLALPNDTNTPGFENEEKSKPKETKIISGSGGLANPEDVGKKIILDALEGSFFSILGFESWLLTILCCGMAPWGGIGLGILQALFMGPLRIVGIILQWHFAKIIKKCAKEKLS